MIVYHFGGSRHLPYTPLIDQVVTASLAAGYSIHVGCASGADAQVIQAALIKNASRLHVFSAFTEKGYGAWSCSATSAVDTAFRYGARVSYLPHVDLSIPLAGRLIRRSITALSGCNASVFFLATKDSSGSLAVAAEAVRRDLPVFAFPVGFWGMPMPPAAAEAIGSMPRLWALQLCAGSLPRTNFSRARKETSQMSISTIMPVLMYSLNPRGKVSAIYCRANLPACYPAAPRGFRVIGVENGKVDLLNLATGSNATVDRSEIFNIRVFVTWEESK